MLNMTVPSGKKPLLRPFGITLFVMLTSLAGCRSEQPATPTVPRNWVNIPALPIIQDAVFSLSPTFAGQRNHAVMMQVCGLARGQAKQEQVNAFLVQQNVDVAHVPKHGHDLSLLVNSDRPAQATACAAYLATTVLSPVDVSELTVAVPQGETQSKAPEQGKQPVLQVDNARLANVLPLKLAAARANADVFVLIAAELQRRPGLTVNEYREQATQLFEKLASVYLECIEAQLPPAGSTYKLLQMDTDRFAFSSSVGSLFEYGRDGMTLRQNGVIWYGQGELMGQAYPLQVAYFEPAIDGLLAPSVEQQP